ncbi:MAG: outer membrane beta-barrel protein [Bacteroidales bacterium]|nr:outer membrane beta-barrel protein [Bacteroidales bacterium]
MKRILLSIVGIIIIGSVYSQVVSESTIRKFNIGVGVSTDIWQGQAPDMKTRTINQGAQVFGMYNYRIKESMIYLAGGIGMGVHNLYSNSHIPDVKADSISFLKIPDNISYKKSKITLAYIDVPLEFRIKTKKAFRIAFGFKFGFLVNASTKYKGNRFTIADDLTASTDGVNVKEKEKDVKQVETWRYGPTFRIGYKWFNVTVYYQLSKVFKVDKGPQLYPISIGIAVIPF